MTNPPGKILLTATVPLRSVIQPVAGNNLVLGLEQQTDRPWTPALAAQSGDKAGFVELQSDFARRFLLVANLREDFSEQFAPGLGVFGGLRFASYGVK